MILNDFAVHCDQPKTHAHITSLSAQPTSGGGDGDEEKSKKHTGKRRFNVFAEDVMSFAQQQQQQQEQQLSSQKKQATLSAFEQTKRFILAFELVEVRFNALESKGITDYAVMEYEHWRLLFPTSPIVRLRDLPNRAHADPTDERITMAASVAAELALSHAPLFQQLPARFVSSQDKLKYTEKSFVLRRPNLEEFKEEKLPLYIIRYQGQASTSNRRLNPPAPPQYFSPHIYVLETTELFFDQLTKLMASYLSVVLTESPKLFVNLPARIRLPYVTMCYAFGMDALASVFMNDNSLSCFGFTASLLNDPTVPKTMAVTTLKELRLQSRKKVFSLDGWSSELSPTDLAQAHELVLKQNRNKRQSAADYQISVEHYKNNKRKSFIHVHLTDSSILSHAVLRPHMNDFRSPLKCFPKGSSDRDIARDELRAHVSPFLTADGTTAYDIDALTEFREIPILSEDGHELKLVSESKRLPFQMSMQTYRNIENMLQLAIPSTIYSQEYLVPLYARTLNNVDIKRFFKANPHSVNMNLIHECMFVREHCELILAKLIYASWKVEKLGRTTRKRLTMQEEDEKKLTEREVKLQRLTVLQNILRRNAPAPVIPDGISDEDIQTQVTELESTLSKLSTVDLLDRFQSASVEGVTDDTENVLAAYLALQLGQSMLKPKLRASANLDMLIAALTEIRDLSHDINFLLRHLASSKFVLYEPRTLLKFVMSNMSEPDMLLMFNNSPYALAGAITAEDLEDVRTKARRRKMLSFFSVLNMLDSKTTLYIEILQVLRDHYATTQSRTEMARLQAMLIDHVYEHHTVFHTQVEQWTRKHFITNCVWEHIVATVDLVMHHEMLETFPDWKPDMNYMTENFDGYRAYMTMTYPWLLSLDTLESDERERCMEICNDWSSSRPRLFIWDDIGTLPANWDSMYSLEINKIDGSRIESIATEHAKMTTLLLNPFLFAFAEYNDMRSWLSRDAETQQRFMHNPVVPMNLFKSFLFLPTRYKILTIEMRVLALILSSYYMDTTDATYNDRVIKMWVSSLVTDGFQLMLTMFPFTLAALFFFRRYSLIVQALFQLTSANDKAVTMYHTQAWLMNISNIPRLDRTNKFTYEASVPPFAMSPAQIHNLVADAAFESVSKIKASVAMNDTSLLGSNDVLTNMPVHRVQSIYLTAWGSLFADFPKAKLWISDGVVYVSLSGTVEGVDEFKHAPSLQSICDWRPDIERFVYDMGTGSSKLVSIEREEKMSESSSSSSEIKSAEDRESKQVESIIWHAERKPTITPRPDVDDDIARFAVPIFANIPFTDLSHLKTSITQEAILSAAYMHVSYATHWSNPTALWWRIRKTLSSFYRSTQEFNEKRYADMSVYAHFLLSNQCHIIGSLAACAILPLTRPLVAVQDNIEQQTLLRYAIRWCHYKENCNTVFIEKSIPSSAPLHPNSWNIIRTDPSNAIEGILPYSKQEFYVDQWYVGGHALGSTLGAAHQSVQDIATPFHDNEQPYKDLVNGYKKFLSERVLTANYKDFERLDSKFTSRCLKQISADFKFANLPKIDDTTPSNPLEFMHTCIEGIRTEVYPSQDGPDFSQWMRLLLSDSVNEAFFIKRLAHERAQAEPTPQRIARQPFMPSVKVFNPTSELDLGVFHFHARPMALFAIALAYVTNAHFDMNPVAPELEQARTLMDIACNVVRGIRSLFTNGDPRPRTDYRSIHLVYYLSKAMIMLFSKQQKPVNNFLRVQRYSRMQRSNLCAFVFASMALENIHYEESLNNPYDRFQWRTRIFFMHPVILRAMIHPSSDGYAGLLNYEARADERHVIDEDQWDTVSRNALMLWYRVRTRPSDEVKATHNEWEFLIQELGELCVELPMLTMSERGWKNFTEFVFKDFALVVKLARAAATNGRETAEIEAVTRLWTNGVAQVLENSPFEINQADISNIHIVKRIVSAGSRFSKLRAIDGRVLTLYEGDEIVVPPTSKSAAVATSSTESAVDTTTTTASTASVTSSTAPMVDSTASIVVDEEKNDVAIVALAQQLASDASTAAASTVPPKTVTVSRFRKILNWWIPAIDPNVLDYC